MNQDILNDLQSRAIAGICKQFGDNLNQPLPQAITALARGLGTKSSLKEGRAASEAIAKSQATYWNSFRAENVKTDEGSSLKVLSKGSWSGGALAKADLDVGTLTNFAQITGGQSLGYVSLDTQLARGTVRPRSFTLYQAMKKSAAYQIVDYWAYAGSTGGPLPGQAFADYGSVTQGALATSAGAYELRNIVLKMALDGRAITTALAAQNSFVNIGEQETANAALSILESVNWSNYWGNSSVYANQPNGLSTQIPSGNTFDWYNYYTTVSSPAGISQAQSLFNLIYEGVGTIASYRAYGRPTHAFMSPAAYSSFQGISTTLLNNIMNDFNERMNTRALTINGDLRGMRTAFGEIGFEIDLFINARDYPAQAFAAPGGGTYATTSSPWAPASIAVVSGASTSGSKFDATYAGDYSYAVAGMDSSMLESELTWGTVSGIPAGGSAAITITPNGAGANAAFRVYRSGKAYTYNSGDTTAVNQVRYIGEVVANGTNAVVFTDLNAHIAGSETIFLLDMDDADDALDYRYLLPLSRINLFQNNLLMPWAVAIIGAPRVRIPKWHGFVYNYVAENPLFNPLSPNNPLPPPGNTIY